MEGWREHENEEGKRSEMCVQVSAKRREGRVCALGFEAKLQVCPYVFILFTLPFYSL